MMRIKLLALFPALAASSQLAVALEDPHDEASDVAQFQLDGCPISGPIVDASSSNKNKFPLPSVVFIMNVSSSIV